MPAVDLRQMVGSLVSTEGIKTSTDLAVAQRAAGANMSVDVAAGTAVIQDDHATGGGFYSYTLSATSNVAPVTVADATNPRIDRVVVRVRDQALGDAANDAAIVILAGTPTSGATLANLNGAAAVPGSSLLLANILIPAAGTSVTTANIGNVAAIVKPVGTTVWRSAGTQTVASSAALTSVLSQSIPGGTIGLNGMLRVTITAKLDIASAETFTFKISLGGTTLYQATSGSLSTANIQMPVTFWVQNLNSQASQAMQGYAPIPNTAQAGATTGLTEPISNAQFIATSGTTAVDTSTAQTLDVSIQHSVSNAGNVYTRYGWLVEVL